jgi:hypothetical protein
MGHLNLTSRQWRALRAAWIVIQVVLSLWMARSGIHFYYQGF